MKKAIRSAVVIAAAVCAAGSVSAQPMQMPARRAGEWRVVMSMRGMASGMTMTSCVDPATEHAYSPFSGGPGGRERAAQDCSQRDVHPIPGGWAFSSVCKAPGGQPTRTSGTVTGDFRSHIHMVVDTERSGGAKRMTMDQTWVGPCSAGGGRTITLPDGRTVHIPGR